MKQWLVILVACGVSACGDAPSKGKKGGSATNNSTNNNATTNNATTNNLAECPTGCRANEECVQGVGEAFCQCLDGFEQTDRGCVSNAINRPPSVTAVSIIPTQPLYPGQPLNCQYAYVDADGDADQSRVEWLIDGIMTGAGPTFAAYLEGESVACRVTAFDGEVDGNTETSDTLVAPLRTLVSTGASHTCIRTRVGSVRCWGDNSYYRVGNTQSGVTLSAVTPVGLEAKVEGIFVGERHTCALVDDTVKCWGKGQDGVAGYSATDIQRPVSMLSGDIRAVSSGFNHVCAIKGSALYCWGLNFFGQLGYPTNAQTFDGVGEPTVVPGFESGVSAVVTGEDHTCAIKNNALHCWGSNAFGALGVPGGNTATPQLTLADNVVRAWAGGGHTCAQQGDTIRCWGANYQQRLGTGAAQNTVNTPMALTIVEGPIDELYLGGSNTCARQNGAVTCWGDDSDGQLKAIGPIQPATVIDGGTTAFSVGSNFMCGEQRGELSCWGNNLSGQTGDPASVGSSAHTPFVVTY